MKITGRVKVTVGCQTDSEKQKESLQDMVSAFLMQNKFLNKEVLELNQLRQQGTLFSGNLLIKLQLFSCF